MVVKLQGLIADLRLGRKSWKRKSPRVKRNLRFSGLRNLSDNGKGLCSKKPRTIQVTKLPNFESSKSKPYTQMLSYLVGPLQNNCERSTDKIIYYFVTYMPTFSRLKNKFGCTLQLKYFFHIFNFNSHSLMNSMNRIQIDTNSLF